MLAFAKGCLDHSLLPVEIDDEGSIRMGRNEANGNRTKHIDIKYLLVRELLKESKIVLEYCANTDMIADIFTELLTRVVFQTLRTKLALRID